MPKKKQIESKDTAGAKTPATSQMDSILESMQNSFSSELIKSGKNHKSYTGKGLSWGMPSLNYACTQNPFVGLVPGRVYELFGAESSGKTTLALHAIADAQLNGAVAAFVDMEHALDPKYASDIGVDMSRLMITQPDYGEQALDIALEFVKQGVPIVVIDSVAALVPKVILDVGMEKEHIGLQARMMSKFMSKFSPQVSKSQSCVIFINQVRTKIGVMFGDPTTTPGGAALKFYASLRMRVSLSGAKSKAITGNYKTLTGQQDDIRLGSVMNCKVVKSKIGMPFQETELNVLYGLGIDKVHDLYDFAERSELITKGRGAYKMMKGTEEIRIPTAEVDEYAEDIVKLLEEKYK